MKLDVSYTDHSHIIGKGGLTIKKVMEETGCHIHFPDSNRSNLNEKSNQVSIAGELEGVEQARARVRVGSNLMWIVSMRLCARHAWYGKGTLLVVS
jgi:protein bicaudal C